MRNRSAKQEALGAIESLAESCGWAQIIYSLRREWALKVPPEVFSRAVEVLEKEERVVSWLTSERRALNWKVPSDLCSTPQGTQEVLVLLGKIENGVYT